MSLKGIAAQTLEIIERGYYLNTLGERVELAHEIERAVEGTVLYRPAELKRLLGAPSPGAGRARIEVCNETTQVAAERLARERDDVVMLNFASAKNAGGGFINGAKAQEEDLARSSALYACLVEQREYYDSNRREPSMLYTDHLIYSPSVPFFRVRNRELIDTPFFASVITAPAPNAGEHLRRHPNGHADVETSLRRRAGYVLAVAKAQGHRCLVLGAWGCGVFRNDPALVAKTFATWLDDEQFANSFDHVELAVWDRSKSRANIGAFERLLGTE